MKTLTEKINGRREWSVYGLSELQKVISHKEFDHLKVIIVANALNECNSIESVGHRSFKIGTKMFLYITPKGDVIVKGLQGMIKEIKDPRTLFDRIRVAWGNLA